MTAKPTMSQVVGLAQRREFLAAAACALEVAGGVEARQGRGRELYESFGAAAKFFHLGGDVQRSLIAFERCFELFESVLAKQDSAVLAVQHLRTWPELFSRAAFAALDAKRPQRAVLSAELGRARMVGALFRSAQHAGADAALEYRHDLNQLTLRLASRAFSDQAFSREERAVADVLRRRRRRLVEIGVHESELSLATALCLPEDIPGVLARGEKRTAVLYAIALDDAIRLVLIDAQGFRELAVPESQIIAAALEALNRSTRESARDGGLNLSSRLEVAFQTACVAIEPRLQSALEAAIEHSGAARLVWIPHGPLVAFPLGVLRVRDGRLNDRVALQVAPSLGVGMRLLDAEALVSPVASAIEGPDQAGETRGGGLLASRLVGQRLDEQHVTDLQGLRRAVASSNFVLMSCHGVFDWSQPFLSCLRLDQDIDLIDVASSHVFGSATMVLLNSCDAGTVAQSAINEPVGLPPALMAAGAHCVIGASQPVLALSVAVFAYLVIDALAAGVSSPEAVQLAARRVRTMRRREVRELLSDLKHPLAERAPRTAGHVPAFDRIVDFGLFQHWGPAWKLLYGAAVSNP